MTDGKSNDPKKYHINLEEQKKRFANKNAKIFALGVGGINNREIRMLTDNDEDSLFYLMSYNDIDQFLSVLENLVREKGFDAETCLPTSLSQASADKFTTEVTSRPRGKERQEILDEMTEAINDSVFDLYANLYSY